MKKIPLLTVHAGIVAGGKDLGDLSYGEVIASLLETKPDGMTLPEMRKAFKIIETVTSAMRDAKDFVLLEEDAYRYLVDRVTENKWVTVTKPILDMLDAITQAKTVDPNHG